MQRRLYAMPEEILLSGMESSRWARKYGVLVLRPIIPRYKVRSRALAASDSAKQPPSAKRKGARKEK
jgi:hypothetical protein